MGEYATYGRGQVKIGTCEDMYYLRFAQRRHVIHETGNVDPVADVAALRFRFPWPDEDGELPGGYSSAYKRVHIPGVVAQTDCEHYSVQFRAEAGYLVSLPCPESDQYTDHRGAYVDGRQRGGDLVTRNGFRGAVVLIAQKWIPAVGRLVPILACGGCGAMWREEDRARIEALAVACRSQADRETLRKDETAAAWWHEVATRVLAEGATL